MKNNFQIFEEWIESSPIEDDGDVTPWDEDFSEEIKKIQYYFVVEADLVEEFEKWIKSCPFKVDDLYKDEEYDDGDSYEYQCWFHIPNDGSFPEEEEEESDF